MSCCYSKWRNKRYLDHQGLDRHGKTNAVLTTKAWTARADQDVLCVPAAVQTCREACRQVLGRCHTLTIYGFMATLWRVLSHQIYVG